MGPRRWSFLSPYACLPAAVGFFAGYIGKRRPRHRHNLALSYARVSFRPRRFGRVRIHRGRTSFLPSAWPYT